MEYPEQFLREFKQDNEYHGKFNVGVQAVHLTRLADFYHRRYKVTKDWTDSIKAHALYNSAGARRPGSSEWEKSAFEIQQEYLKDKFSLSFDQQQNLTASLKHDLESIREQSRGEISEVDQFVNNFDDKGIPVETSTALYGYMKKLSMNCTENMSQFAGRIIRQSVAMISPYKPPCDFVAVAIGSLARGEATPYSDLEYLFLVEDKSQYSLEYFEQLAIASYFQIANLGETRLNYMSIKELKGWFDDQSKNGFKIDGLSVKAGNIPAGNGSSQQLNHFIVTPQELAGRYQTVLDNPDEKEALRGDLTAMLTYMRSIYSQSIRAMKLLTELKDKIENMVPSDERLKVNLNMFKHDIQKFDFQHGCLRSERAFTADVKPDFYRIPSIILLDMSCITHTFTTCSWESLEYLYVKDLLSADLYHELQFLLAAALYMRLSAYLFHNSQDGRISVAPTYNFEKEMETQSRTEISQRRWFVPNGISATICNKAYMMTHRLSHIDPFSKDDVDNVSSESIEVHNPDKSTMFFLTTTKLDVDSTWSQGVALFSSGRDRESLNMIQHVYDSDLCEDPLSVLLNLPSDLSLDDTLYILAVILFSNCQYKAALVVNLYLTDRKVFDVRLDLAACYRYVGDYNQALAILETVNEEQPELAQAQLSAVHFDMGEYDQSEEACIKALDYEHFHLIPSEEQNDHDSHMIDPDVAAAIQDKNTEGIHAAEERLSRITRCSAEGLNCVQTLGYIYFGKEQYTLATAYLQKFGQLVLELYGEGAAVQPMADMKTNLAFMNIHIAKDYNTAIMHSTQALFIERQLSKRYEEKSYAMSLVEIGHCYYAKGEYHQAELHYKQALAVHRKLPRVGNYTAITATLLGLGLSYSATGRFSTERNVNADLVNVLSTVTVQWGKIATVKQM